MPKKFIIYGKYSMDKFLAELSEDKREIIFFSKKRFWIFCGLVTALSELTTAPYIKLTIEGGHLFSSSNRAAGRSNPSIKETNEQPSFSYCNGV